MSREQRQALDEVLRNAPQLFSPAGRPALVVEREVDTRPGTIVYFHGGGNVFGSALAYRLSQSGRHQVLADPAAGDPRAPRRA